MITVLYGVIAVLMIIMTILFVQDWAYHRKLDKQEEIESMLHVLFDPKHTS